MADYPINHHLYTYLWNKYRPAILKLMVDSAEAPQEYKFSQHEFKDVNPREKGGHSFSMEVYKSKSLTDIRKSVVAQDLLLILQRSGRAQELLESASFEFTLDKNFLLTISRTHLEETDGETVEESTSEVVAAEETIAEAVSEEQTVEKVEASEEEVSEEQTVDEISEETDMEEPAENKG